MLTNPQPSQAQRSQQAEPEDPAVKVAAAWVGQLARTLKTCRLYDANNPTVIKFREELAAALRRALEETGPWTLSFTSDGVFLEDASLYLARSRDDNLALPFFRDGVRAITLRPGIGASEVSALLDCVLQVTGQNLTNDDLVTLLWEAELPHCDIDYAPADDDVGGSTTAVGSSEEDPLPWPAAGGPQVAAAAPEPTAEGGPRSDDWATEGLGVTELEAEFEELATLAEPEAVRFRGEYEAERAESLVGGTLAVARAFLAAGADEQDRREMASFLPRLLRQSVSRGEWLQAREALGLLRSCGPTDWSLEGFAQELLQPISVTAAVEHLDKQEAQEVIEYTQLAREIGDPGLDWINQVLAESQQRRNRRLLAEAIAQQCRDNPERLAPWLSDPRWFVVRNVVHILGWIGGPGIVGLLQVAGRHPEPRVRTEVAAALGQVEPKLARPILLKMLEGADTRLFCSILHQLSAERDPEVAKRLLLVLQDPEFEQHPAEEQRAVFSALGSCGGDGILADLEAELLKGSWFARFDPYRQQIARVIARVGTPLAREVLERNAASKRSAVRKACEDALAGFGDHE
jgi:HEAT repeat protein